VTLVVFIAGVLASLAASAVLVTRIERVGERLGAPEAMLGLVTALAADSPEISAAAVAIARGQREVGVGVVLGSNVFNLAALLGLSALVAGRISLHRRVVLLEGVVALWVAAVTLATVAGVVAPSVGLGLTLAVFIPYVIVSALPPVERHRLPLPGA
jgi:cation:H+ antiporter